MMNMRTTRIVGTVLVFLVLSVFLGGCGDEFFDPTQIGRFRPVPAVNVILDSLGVAEERQLPWAAGAEEPRPIDVVVYETDYVFNHGDIVRISIYELFTPGIPLIDNYIITETGKISVPEIGLVQAEGLTESQLEEEIKQIVSPGILKEPSITVSLVSSQQKAYSIQGNGIPRPSRYPIPRYDFRLLDALAIAGGVGQFNISYVYVTRVVTGREQVFEQSVAGKDEAGELVTPEDEMLEIIAPRAQGRWSDNSMIITSSEMAWDPELVEAALPQGFEISAESHESIQPPLGPETIDKPINDQDSGRIEWVFQDGKWVPIQVGRPDSDEPSPKIKSAKAARPLEEKLPDAFGWEQIGTGGVQSRLIEIPTDKLFGGNPRYNIVIRPGDVIHVPVDMIGEFYVMGNLNRVGPIPLTGRPLTLKMAISAAGGLGPLAWPKRCEITRRIGKNREETVVVDLDKIAKGEQPDFFIKPHDLINVGTHPTARWRAVLRNSFRATYGFGFLYDRNYGNRDFGTSRPIPSFIDRIF